MNRLVRGSIMVVAAAVSWACSTDLGKDADVTDHLVATPSVVLVANTDSETVDVEALNPDGQQLAADFSITNGGSGGIVVRQDTSFLPIPGGHSPVRARFVVRGATTTTFVTETFTVSANGKSVTVPVSITPASLDIAFSDPAPALGVPVTLTAPTNVRFTPQTTLTFGLGVTAQSAVITGLSADSTVITFLLPPGITAQTAAVTDIVVTYLPGQVFDVNTTGALTTPVLTTFDPVYSTTTPQTNGTVDLSAPGFKFLPGVEVRFGTDVQTALSISADSNTVTFRAHKPGASGTVSVSGMALSFLTSVPVTLDATGGGVTVGAVILSLAGTNAFATAPIVAIPSTGKTGGVYDNGPFLGTCAGFPCKLYRFDIAEVRTIGVSATWDTSADEGIYIFNATFAGPTNIGCDNLGPAPGQFESCTITALATGTYYFSIIDFSPAYPPPDDVPPTTFTIDLIGQ